ncbi:MAG: RHS repeat-associated core domain-containing protein, partial [Burkholderiales bacterium]
GRPTRSEIAGIAPVNYGYDPRGRLTTITQGEGPQARQLTLAYGSDGFVHSITDALTRQVIYQRDAAGRVTQAALPGARTLNLAYDPNGNVTGITPPGRPEHAFQYTPVDLQAEYQPPAAGLPLSKTQYTYNRDKQLTATQRPDGSAVNLSYDTAGRLQTITPSPGSGEAIHYAYQNTTGLLASIETAGLNLAFMHDGKLKKQETLTGPVAGTLNFTHDENFRITGISVNGQSVLLAHDPDGLLTQAGELTLTRDTASGLVTGTSLANLTTTQGYNPFGELTSFQASHNASALLHYSLSYDPLGRITAKDETVGGVTTAFQYQYDPAGRLEEVRRDGSTTTRYGYDANGNRVSLDGSPIATYDDQDRLLTYGGTTYSYTANGTLTQKAEGSQITQYTYDAFGNLRSVTLPNSTQIDYLIDGKNRRVGKKINGVLTQGWLYHDQLKIAAEVDGSGNLVSRFVYGTKVNVPEYMQKGGKTYRLVTDHLGSVHMVVDAISGEIAQRIDYDEFGKVLSDTHPGFQPFGFAGGLYDPQTKLVRFGARDYDAQTGRWTAKDPIGFGGGDWNLFHYVENEPIGSSDPSGLFAVPILPPPPIMPIQPPGGRDPDWPFDFPRPRPPVGVPTIPVPEPPRPPSPKPPGKGCQALYAACVKTLSPSCSPTGAIPLCFALYLLCEAAGESGG